MLTAYEQHVRMWDSGAFQRGSATRMSVEWWQTRSVWNVGQRCVNGWFCNAFERRSAMLTAYEQRVRMWDSGAYQRGSATRMSVEWRQTRSVWNVGQWCVDGWFCCAYERRSAMLTAYEQHLRM